MKPTTELERRVEQLSMTLKGLTPGQREWGLSRMVPHHATYKARTHEVRCFDCGHTWTEEDPVTCPYCGAKLKLDASPLRKVFTDFAWYGLVQKVEEFTVIRIFFMKIVRRKNGDNEDIISEVLQHWVDSSGRDTIRARMLGMNSYYLRCPFNLNSPLSIKRDRRLHGYRNPHLHIIPDGFYPKMTYSPILRRNGFRSSFHGMEPEDALCALLSDNRFETLWKLKRWGWANRYLFPDRNRIRRHWRAVLKCPSVKPQESSLYLDTLDLMEHFGISSKGWNVPSHPEVISLHDRLRKRKDAEDERRRIAEIKLQEKEAVSVLESKSRFFGITFGNDSMNVIVLKSVEDYMDEGNKMHHCVFTNSYYGKKDSLVLSARMKDNPSKPVETVEISLRDGKILQCFGPCNAFTPHHQEILDLVGDNSWRFIHS